MARRFFILTIFLVTLVIVFLFFSNKKEKEETVTSNEISNSSKTDNSAVESYKQSNGSKSVTKKQINSTSSVSSISDQNGFSRGKINTNNIRGTSSLNSKSIDEHRLDKPSFLEGTSWEIWSGVTAVHKKNGQPKEKILSEVNGFYLVQADNATSDVHNFSASNPLVVVDRRLNIAGVLTGVFSVTLKEGVSVEALAQTDGIKVLDSFPATRTYFITSSNDPFDLQLFYDFLKSTPDVENFHPEVLSRHYEKN
ncbi:MAG: hypothetical protein ACXVCP_02845 [Bdellovibrio sp.]